MIPGTHKLMFTILGTLGSHRDECYRLPLFTRIKLLKWLVSVSASNNVPFRSLWERGFTAALRVDDITALGSVDITAFTDVRTAPAGCDAQVICSSRVFCCLQQLQQRSNCSKITLVGIHTHTHTQGFTSLSYTILTSEYLRDLNDHLMLQEEGSQLSLGPEVHGIS